MGSTLKEIRRSRGLSQARLSDLSGVHRVTIARYEAGTNEPTAKNLAKLAKALGVTMEDLMREKAG